MSQPTELPTEPIVGATVISELSSDSRSKQNHLHAQTSSSPLIASPTVQSLREPTPEFDPHVGAKPCSPFYGHDDTNNASLEYFKNEATITAHKYASNDLESGTPSTPQKRSIDIIGCSRKSKLWKDKRRKCNLFSTLTKRQRLWAKLALALFVVGVMIGIAMGITAAVGGGVWKSANVRGNFGR